MSLIPDHTIPAVVVVMGVDEPSVSILEASRPAHTFDTIDLDALLLSGALWTVRAATLARLASSEVFTPKSARAFQSNAQSLRELISPTFGIDIDFRSASLLSRGFRFNSNKHSKPSPRRFGSFGWANKSRDVALQDATLPHARET